MSNEYISNSLMNGFMVKRGSFVRSWKRRFFVLTHRAELLYFQQKDDQFAIKCLHLTPHFEFTKSPKHEFGFIIKRWNNNGKKQKDFHCYAETEEEYVEWKRCFTELSERLKSKGAAASMVAAANGGILSEEDKQSLSERNAIRRMMKEIFQNGSESVIAHSTLEEVQVIKLNGIEKGKVPQDYKDYIIRHWEDNSHSDWYRDAAPIQINTTSSVTPQLATVITQRVKLRNDYKTAPSVKRAERVVSNFRKKFLAKHDVEADNAPLNNQLLLLFDVNLLLSMVAVQNDDLDALEMHLDECQILLKKTKTFLEDQRTQRKINGRLKDDLIFLSALDNMRLLYMTGWRHAQCKDPQSIRYYKEALRVAKEYKLDPITRCLLIIISEQYFQDGDYMKSRNYYRKVNRLDLATNYALVKDGETIYTIYNCNVSKRTAGTDY